MKHDLIIIGAGASGIMASIIAKDFGIDVAIIERNDRIGKKILTTGNGRCNITNKNIELSRYHSNNKDFFKYALENFSVDDTIEFFKSIGLHLCTLENNKMYPLSLQASSVVDLFRLALEDRGIPIYFNSKVKSIKKKKEYFNILCNDNEPLTCKFLLVCTGGKSATKTGSDGSGFNLVKELGHNIIPPLPSLVQLKLNYKKLKALSGTKFEGTASIYVNNELEKTEVGEILFTDYGISGPPILQLSRIASLNTFKNKNVILKVDMMNGLSKKDLQIFLENHFGIFAYRSISEALIGIIHKKIIPIILKESGITDIHKPCWSLDWQEKDNLIKLLKEWTFEVIGTNSFENAQVTAGGIDTSGVYNETLESKIVKDLYFAGEILDVDGDCGGFNLQWAWSSAAISINSIKNSLY